MTVRRFAKAAVVAALLSTLGAAQGTGLAMPASCKQNQLDKCSEQFWTRDSFPRKGFQNSVTFSNGETLTCTSNGRDTPRTCELKAPATLDDTQAQDVREQCADLRQKLKAQTEDRQAIQTSVDRDNAYFARVMQMTPAELDQAIQKQQSLVHDTNRTPSAGLSRSQQSALDKRTLDFLEDLRNSPFLDSQVGSSSTAKMQARANDIANEQQEMAMDQKDKISQAIAQLGKQITDLNCATYLPSAFQ